MQASKAGKDPSSETSNQEAIAQHPAPAPAKPKSLDLPTIIAPIRGLTIKAKEARLRAISKLKDQPLQPGDLTQRLENAPLDLVALLKSLASRLVAGRLVQYRRLPYQSPSSSMPAAPVWRIELHGSKLGADPVGIDVCGDVVIGRGANCDFDMDAYFGYESGISRRHAMLRPSGSHLFLMDLGSANGTFYNTVPLPSNSTHSLKHDDLISLGQFNITLKVIKPPDPESPGRDKKRPDSLPSV